jgi:hypothetical protein
LRVRNLTNDYCSGVDRHQDSIDWERRAGNYG